MTSIICSRCSEELTDISIPFARELGWLVRPEDTVWHGPTLCPDCLIVYRQDTSRYGRQLTIHETINLAKQTMDVKYILEIGSIRKPEWTIGDGHATIAWCMHFPDAQIASIDNDIDCTVLTREMTRDFSNIACATCDGIEFLNALKIPIDILYLDAWDAIPSIPYKEKHLEAFLIADSLCHKNSLILIDDTQHGDGGKGGFLVPRALESGWRKIFDGQQTLLQKYE